MFGEDLLSPFMCIEIGVLRDEGVVQWLVQLSRLAMVAGSNVWWQGFEIKQCRLEGGVMVRESVHRRTMLL